MGGIICNLLCQPAARALRGLLCSLLTVLAASIDVHADAPNYRPPSTTVSKKECDERKHAKAMHEWQSGEPTSSVRMLSSHGLALSNSLRFLRGQLRGCASF